MSNQQDEKIAPKTGGDSQGSQDFSKFAQGPRAYGQASSVKRASKASGQFAQTAPAAPAKDAGQFGQSSGTPESTRGQFGQESDSSKGRGQLGQAAEYAAKERGQFGQGTETSAKGRGQFGQGGMFGKKRSQFGQVAPSEMHSQNLGQRQEETLRRAHQQKAAEETLSKRFRILAASIAVVVGIGLILGIALALSKPPEKMILGFEINMNGAKTSYRVGEQFEYGKLSITINYVDGSQEEKPIEPEWLSGGSTIDSNRAFTVASSSAAPIKLTITYRGIQKSFNVTVERSIVGLNTVSEITKVELDRTVYDESDPILEQGAKIYYKTTGSSAEKMVVINQNDTNRTNLDKFGAGYNWDWYPKNFSVGTSGDVDVTIKHKDGFAEKKISVYVRGLTETAGTIEITKKPLFTSYSVGDELIRIGLVVSSVMRDGETKVALQPNQYVISPTTFLDAGNRIPVQVTYISESGKRLTAEFPVTVLTDLKPNYNPDTDSLYPPEERGLVVNTAPSKKVYTVWDTIETVGTSKVVPGFTLTARYADGRTETVPVTRSMIMSSDLDYAGRFTKIGTAVLTIRYKGLSVTQNITVIDGVRSLRVLGSTQTLYQSGDFLGRMAIEVVYNAVSPLTGLNNRETLTFNGLQEAVESGFTVVCWTGGYDVNHDEFTQGLAQLYFTYGNAWVDLWVTVVDHITVTEIFAGYSDFEIALGESLDLSKIYLQAYRDTAGVPYPDGQTFDIISVDRSRLVTINSVTDITGNATTPEIYSGTGGETKLTFTSTGLKYIKVTYEGGASSVFTVTVK